MKARRRVFKYDADPDTHAVAKLFFRSRERTLKDVVDELLWHEMERIEAEEKRLDDFHDEPPKRAPGPKMPWEEPAFYEQGRKGRK